MVKDIFFVLITIIGLSVCYSETSAAQDEPDHLTRGARNYGYIITLDGDTIAGYILNLNLWNNQMMTFYFKDLINGDKGTKYRAKELKGYKVGPREYEMLKFAGLYSPYKHNFFLRKMDGAIDYYIWYYHNDVNTLMGTDVLLTEAADARLIDEEILWTQSIGRTSSGEIIEFGSMRFRMKFNKHMSRLVEDYPEMAEKIRNKEEGYRFEDLEKIIREYNEWKEVN